MRKSNLIKLRDWLPFESLDEISQSDKIYNHLNEVCVNQYNSSSHDEEVYDNYGIEFKPSPFTHKYVMNWCVLESGYAIGWNENPSLGWSFPIKKLK